MNDRVGNAEGFASTLAWSARALSEMQETPLRVKGFRSGVLTSEFCG